MSDFFKFNLVYLREIARENQTQCSTALGLTRSTYANYEIGENEPKAKVLMKILGHFNVSFEELMSNDLRNVNQNKKSDTKKREENVNQNVNQNE